MTRAGLRRPGHVDAQRTINIALQQVHLDGPAFAAKLSLRNRRITTRLYATREQTPNQSSRCQCMRLEVFLYLTPRDSQPMQENRGLGAFQGFSQIA